MVLFSMFIVSCSAFETYPNSREPVLRQAVQENWSIVMLTQHPEGFVLINGLSAKADVYTQMNAANISTSEEKHY